jgi:hypothetical protein
MCQARTLSTPSALRVLVVALMLIAGKVPAQPAPDIAGVWQVTHYQTGVRTVDGELPPLTPAGMAAYERNLAERKEPKPRSDMTRCVPSGTPRVMWAPLPMMILQTPRKITFIHEYQHQLRHIYLDEPLPAREDIELSFMGESVGHWEAQTLVVDTFALHADTVLDREGLPKTPEMSIVERLRLIDDGQRLEDLMTLTDPAMYERPWTTRIVYERRPDVQLKEYNCLEKYEDL